MALRFNIKSREKGEVVNNAIGEQRRGENGRQEVVEEVRERGMTENTFLFSFCLI